MNSDIAVLIDNIHELEAELAKSRAELRVGLEKGRAFFEEEILRRHRELKTRRSHHILNANPLVILIAPLIYAMIVPLLLLDLCVTIYQVVCFPVYQIQKVSRSDYLVFRPAPSRLPQRVREAQLCLLFLRQWVDRLCP
jgi:hypothetical protein